MKSGILKHIILLITKILKGLRMKNRLPKSFFHLTVKRLVFARHLGDIKLRDFPYLELIEFIWAKAGRVLISGCDALRKVKVGGGEMKSLILNMLTCSVSVDISTSCLEGVRLQTVSAVWTCVRSPFPASDRLDFPHGPLLSSLRGEIKIFS